MGRVASAYGIRGWVKIQPFTEYVDSLLEFSSWWIGPENGPWREIQVKNCDVHGKTLVAHVLDCIDRTQAEKLKGLLLAVPRSALPEQDEDEYYWADLIGLNVITQTGALLGKVENLLETGANQVLSVRSEQGALLIPFVASAIQKVDIANRTIHVEWAQDYLA